MTKEKVYKIHDLQGGYFMAYTHDNPWTAEKIRLHLIEQIKDHSLLDEDDEDFKAIDNYTFEEVQEHFDISAEEIIYND